MRKWLRCTTALVCGMLLASAVPAPRGSLGNAAKHPLWGWVKLNTTGSQFILQKVCSHHDAIS